MLVFAFRCIYASMSCHFCVRDHSSGNGTIRYRYEFLLAFHTNYCPILYHFRDKRDIGRKSNFIHISLHLTPHLAGLSRNIAVRFGVEKLEFCGYPTVKKINRKTNCCHETFPVFDNSSGTVLLNFGANWDVPLMNCFYRASAYWRAILI